MRCRILAPLALAGVALLAACDDGLVEPRVLNGPTAAGPRFAAVNGAEESYAYKCGLSIAPDQTQANADLSRLYNEWKAAFVTSSGAGGYRRVTVGQVPWDPARTDDTYSEGIGYGMLLAAYMDDKALLDDLWGYAKLHLNARGLMVWDVNGDGTHPYDSNNVYNAATDGDEDIAFALIVADKKWGGYQTAATTLLNNLLTHGVGADNVFRSEDYWHKQGGDVVNPSYLDPGYYKTFAQYTGVSRWNLVAAKSYEIIAAINGLGANTSTGLLPEWSRTNGTVTHDWNPVTGAYDGNAYAYHYGYNSIRAPLRLARDYAWWCDGTSATQLQRMNNFWKQVTPAGIVDGYALDGTVLNQGYTPAHNLPFVGSALAAASGPTDAAHRSGMWTETLGMTELSYYGSSLRLLALLIASGNMPNPLFRTIDSFEDGNYNGWSTYTGGGATIALSMSAPGALNSNSALKVDFNAPSGGWLGAQTSYWNGAQNWQGFSSIGFRFYGGNTGNVIRFTISDNGATASSAEGFEYSFTDNFTGWKSFTIPWSSFTRSSWQPAGAPNDGFNRNQIWGFGFSPAQAGAGSFRVDQIELYR